MFRVQFVDTTHFLPFQDATGTPGRYLPTYAFKNIPDFQHLTNNFRALISRWPAANQSRTANDCLTPAAYKSRMKTDCRQPSAYKNHAAPDRRWPAAYNIRVKLTAAGRRHIISR